MKNACRVSIVLTAVCLAALRFCFAEEVDLEKIVVTPSRIESEYDETSRDIDVITYKNIERSAAADISGLLTDLPSVNISDYGGIGSLKNIRMRGSTAAQVLVMIDGRPVNNPRDGTVDLSSIPLDDISKVEALRGPASSLYGSSAMGGVVNIITKNPPAEGHKTQITSGYGTFRTYTERLSHGAKISKLGYMINGGYVSSEGFRTNSEFNSKDFSAKFEYGPNDNNNLALNCGFYKDHRGAPGRINTPQPSDKQDNLKNFLDLKYDFKFGDFIKLASRVYNNYDRLEFVQKMPDVTKYIHTTNMRGLDLQYSQKFADIYSLVSGFNYVDNLNDSTTSAKHKYSIRAGFIDNKWELFNKLNLGLGARVDDYSNFGTQASPNLNIGYKLNQNNKAHFLVSRSFRAPTFNDLYWPRIDYFWGGFWVGAEEGNTNLKPEKGTTIETGFDSKINEHISISLTYYRSKYDDLINWAEVASVWSPSNIGSAVMDGIEFQNKISPIKGLDINFSYTFLRAKDDKTNKYLVYQPKGKYDLGLLYKGFKGFNFELKGQYTGSRFHDPDNFTKVKSFIVLGLDISKKVNKQLTCLLSFQNLLNKKYQVIKDYPSPGLSIDGRIKAEF